MITKFDKDLATHIEIYSAYVYRIIITFPDGTKKTYIGAHKGSIYDSYDFSTESPEFIEDLKNYEHYFEIYMKGSEYDMFDLENQMLEKVDAKNPDNKEYYNNTNGGSRYTSVSAKTEAYVKSLNEKLNNGELDQYKVSTPIKEVKEWEKVQVRADELTDGDYTNSISAKINSKLGDTSFLPPGLSFDGWKDSSLWVDGNQRLDGIDKSKLGEDIIHYNLPSDLQEIIIHGIEAMNTWMLCECDSKNSIYLNKLINEKGVILKQFPDEVIRELKRKTNDVIDELISKDEKSKEVFQHYKKFRESIEEWSAVSDKMYYTL